MATKGKILDYTTEVPVIRTLAQIEDALAKGGASSVTKKYDDNGMPIAVEFEIQTKFGVRSIRLPANVQAIYYILAGDGYQNETNKARLQQRANKIAWRIILRWVQAQMAIIQTEMVDLSEVLLPYMITSGNKTMYQELVDRQLLLPAPGEVAEHE